MSDEQEKQEQQSEQASPSSSTKQWYVVRVASGREGEIKETLMKRVKALGMESQVSAIVIPTERVIEIRAGKKSTREKKLYPGYLMVEMELDEKTWYTVRETPGIGDFLGLKTPVPMEPYEVERVLRSMEEAQVEAPKIKVGFKKGDSVRIKDGPFENFDGQVEEVNMQKGIVSVTITIFGRSTKVDLEYWQLEKI